MAPSKKHFKSSFYVVHMGPYLLSFSLQPEDFIVYSKAQSTYGSINGHIYQPSLYWPSSNGPDRL